MSRAEANESVGMSTISEHTFPMQIDKNAAGALDVFFDESGFTGPRLLDPAQRFFSYASVAITDDEAWTIINRARENHPVQMPELKASKLLGSTAGIALIAEVIEAVEGRYAFVLQDKLLVLCGKIFEYIFEPVFQYDPSLLYRKNLHKFVAMYCFIFFQGQEAEEAIRQFERFMRTLDPSEAPLLFNADCLGDIADDDPFKMVVQFAQGYRDIIVADNQQMRVDTPDAGKWALDVSIAGLWSLLNHWGATGRPLRVTCDDSKPLRDQVSCLTGGDDDPGIRRALDVSSKDEAFGWTFAQAIAFGDSRNHPGLQIADLIAGTASRILTQSSNPGLERVRSAMMRHIHAHSIMPDFDYVKLGTREVDVNWIVLMELGQRAAKGIDPQAGLADFYAVAEATWLPNRLGGDAE